MNRRTSQSVKHWIALLLVLSLSACVQTPKKPDLNRLYNGVAVDVQPPPMIVIHGMMGSTLVNSETGVEIWPKSLGSVALSEYRELSNLPIDGASNGNVVAGKLLDSLGRVDFYGTLLETLRTAGGYRPGYAGHAVNDNYPRYYVFTYDWRQSNTESSKNLHEFIEQLRVDHRDPKLKVDIIAHSNGGILANYYLRYGPNDVLNQEQPQMWAEGNSRIRRIAMLGTPNLGAASSIKRLVEGFRLTLRIVPVEVLAGIVPPFEALPHPNTQVIYDVYGKPVNLDIFDPEIWRRNQWGIYSPEVSERILSQNGSLDDRAARVLEVQNTFANNLRRSKKFIEAITLPIEGNTVRTAVFGGDCANTLAAGILIEQEGKQQLVFNAKQIKNPVPGVDYESILFQPGDQLVTRVSQEAAGFEFMPLRQSMFLCENHQQLAANAFFQNNLLSFFLAR